MRFILDAGGKRDENLILPLNDSLSGTLNTDQVRNNFITLLIGKFYKFGGLFYTWRTDVCKNHGGNKSFFYQGSDVA